MNDPSLWLDRPRPASSPRLPGGSRFDAVVVGAGLTGLCTALELSRAGAAVAVLEGRRAGSVTTGRTTGKISLLQGTKLSQIAGRYPTDVVRAYVEANRDGRRRLLGLCRSFEVPVQVEMAYTYATSSEGATALAAEFDAATEAGLDVRWDEAAELPFPVTGAIGLADQAQFDPVDLVTALVRELRGRGVPVVENTRVRSVGRTPGGLAVRHDGGGELVADRVVLATGTPVLDRGAFFARLEPQRSYCIAVAGTDQPPRGMYLSADSPTRSLRYAPTPDGDLLIVGGNGHTVGRGGATQPRVADLIDWTRRHFPGGEVTHTWSAQDYHSADQLPVVGGLLPTDDRILIASGYDKWGLTNAVAAAAVIAARIDGEPSAWAASFDPWALSRAPRSALPTLELNAGVAVEMVKGWVGPVVGFRSSSPAEGEGRVQPGVPVPRAVCTVDGRTHRVSAVCPHLGGIVRWNDSERSWDCPLHGSRFAADGRVLEGPATRGLSASDCVSDRRGT
ncbi:FAD-dependent oxidoreductase [Prescottella equi]